MLGISYHVDVFFFYGQVSTVTFGAAMAPEIRWHRALQLLREVREAREIDGFNGDLGGFP